jgi:hypothetical protein
MTGWRTARVVATADWRGEIRAVAGGGRGRRMGGFDPLQVAEEECGWGDSTRCRLRKRKADGGTRPVAGCGRGRRDVGLRGEMGGMHWKRARPHRGRALSTTSSPHLSHLSPSTRIPLPPPATDRVPVPAFLFRNLQRVESRLQHSSSATCNGPNLSPPVCRTTSLPQRPLSPSIDPWSPPVFPTASKSKPPNS